MKTPNNILFYLFCTQHVTPQIYVLFYYRLVFKAHFVNRLHEEHDIWEKYPIFLFCFCLMIINMTCQAQNQLWLFNPHWEACSFIVLWKANCCAGLPEATRKAYKKSLSRKMDSKKEKMQRTWIGSPEGQRREESVFI